MDLVTESRPGIQPLAASGSASLLRLEISVSYQKRNVLENIALEMAPGEILGLVGASGSGKSTIALSILGLLYLKGGVVSGRIEFSGSDLLQATDREMRKLRGSQIALVPQSPLSALNPALPIGAQLREAWLAHPTPAGGDWKTRALELFAKVSLPSDEAFLKRYPRQLSVGMAQRVLIAMAVLHRPRLLLADEPTSALDVITQAEILELFRQLNQESGMAILCISHDLLSVANLCQRIAIVDQGRVVETGLTADIFNKPAHFFTQRLIQAMPKPLVEADRLSSLKNLSDKLSTPQGTAVQPTR